MVVFCLPFWMPGLTRAMGEGRDGGVGVGWVGSGRARVRVEVCGNPVESSLFAHGCGVFCDVVPLYPYMLQCSVMRSREVFVFVESVSLPCLAGVYDLVTRVIVTGTGCQQLTNSKLCCLAAAEGAASKKNANPPCGPRRKDNRVTRVFAVRTNEQTAERS